MTASNTSCFESGGRARADWRFYSEFLLLLTVKEVAQEKLDHNSAETQQKHKDTVAHELSRAIHYIEEHDPLARLTRSLFTKHHDPKISSLDLGRVEDLYGKKDAGGKGQTKKELHSDTTRNGHLYTFSSHYGAQQHNPADGSGAKHGNDHAKPTDHSKRSGTGDAKNIVPLEHERKHEDNHPKNANYVGHHREHGQVKHAQQEEHRPRGKAEAPQLIAPVAPAPSDPEAPTPIAPAPSSSEAPAPVAPALRTPEAPTPRTPEAPAPRTPEAPTVVSPVSPAPEAIKPVEAPKPAEAVPTQTTALDQKVIDQKADELHAALHKRGLMWRSAPDVQSVTNALSGTNAADRKRIEESYQSHFGDQHPLRAELKQFLGEEDYRRAESTLNARDGRTNDAGALMSAITTASHDKERGSNEVLAVLQNLDSKKLAQLKEDFQKDYGVSMTSALVQSEVNDTTRESIPTLIKGIDRTSAGDISKLAQIALAHGDKRAFCEALRGDSPEAKEARAKLSESTEFRRQAQDKFLVPALRGGDVPYDQGKDWLGTIDPVVADYIKDGRISLQTIVQGNDHSWPFNNKENTALALQNATETERQRYATGKILVEIGTQNLSNEQKNAVDYYHGVHDALGRAFNPREASVNEDKLLHGRETIVGELARQHSDGICGINSGHKPEDLLNSVEHLSKADWQLLSPQQRGSETKAEAESRSATFRKEIEQSLSTYTDTPERNRILSLLDAKARSSSFEESQTVKRGIVDVIADNRSYGLFGSEKIDSKEILHHINELSPQDAERYAAAKPGSHNAYREYVDNFVNTKLTGIEQVEARRLLAQVAATGKPPVPDAIDKMLAAKMNGADCRDIVALSETALSDPAVRARLRLPADQLSSDEQLIKKQIHDACMQLSNRIIPPGAGGGYGHSVELQASGANLEKALYENGHIQAETKLECRFPLKDVMAQLPSASADERQKAEYRFMTAEEKQVIEKASENIDHKLNLADRIRLAAIESKGKQGTNDELAAEISTLSNEQKVALKNDYATKYGSRDMDSDLIKTMGSSEEQAKFRRLLATTDGDGRQTYYENYNAMLKSESGFSPDASMLTAERANDMMATSLQEYNKIYKTLPKEKQEALDKYFGDAMKQYKDSKEKLAEVVVDATIAAAAIAAAPFTGGTSMALLMSEAAAFGAAYRVAAMAAIQGSDFDWSGRNVSQQMLAGGMTAATSVFGRAPLAIAEGGARLISQEGAIAAAKYLAREAVENGLTGASANLLTDLVVAPFNKDGIDIDHLESSVTAGFVGGAVIPLVFKGVLKVNGVTRDLIINATKAENGLVINPKNLTDPVSLKNTKTGQVINFEPGKGEPMKLTRDWLPKELADKNVQVDVPKPVAQQNPQKSEAQKSEALQKPAQDKAEKGDGKPRDAQPEEPRAKPDAPKAKPDMQVEEGDVHSRTVTIDGKKYDLVKKQGQIWYGPARSRGGANSPVKVHVTTPGNGLPSDLDHLQAALIPALHDDPELQKLVTDWKTFDPYHAVGKSDHRGPGDTGNYAKAFTIYTDSAEKAQKIQQRIDQILHEKHLDLARPAETGNVDVISGKSNRVGVCRDTFTPARGEHGLGAQLEDSLTAKINQEFGLKANERLSNQQLRDLERKTGLLPNTLSYGAQVKGEAPKLILAISDNSSPYHGELYLDESRAGKEFGSRTDRPAMYALADRYKLDQVKLAAEAAARKK